MPKIAFLPVVMLWLGVYDVSKISMVAVEAIFPVVTATVVGIRGVERELFWSARNMGAGERELLWQIAFPAALPQIITGLQVALPIALIVAIVTEMFMGGYGLGGAMNTASRFADSRGVFAGIVEIAVIGYALVKGMSLAPPPPVALASGGDGAEHGVDRIDRRTNETDSLVVAAGRGAVARDAG